MTVKPKVWRAVFKRDKGCCRYCRENLLRSVSTYFSATVDHIVARAAGGRDEEVNLVACCPACNSMLTRQSSLQTFEGRLDFVQKRREEEEEQNLLWWREQIGQV